MLVLQKDLLSFSAREAERQTDRMFTGYFSGSRPGWVCYCACVLCGSPGSVPGRILEEESSLSCVHAWVSSECVGKHLKILH